MGGKFNSIFTSLLSRDDDDERDDGQDLREGICVAWNAKGFGFIRPRSGARSGPSTSDYYFHVTNLADGEGRVGEGDVVEFRVARSEWTGKLEAIDVRRVQSGSDNERRNGRRDERREQGAAHAARVPSEDTNE